MAKTKNQKGGPYLKNAHLIGKGGGQVKKVDGSFAKGAKKTEKKGPPKPPAKSTPKPAIKEHISTTPLKKPGGDSPGRGRTLSSTKKPLPVSRPATPKKTPPKAAMSKLAATSPKAVPKKAAPAKKSPVKGR